MAHTFSQIPSVNIPRSVFPRSSGRKTTFDIGDLIPIFCDEVLPGDTHTMRTSIFARLSTPIHPIMDNIYLDTFWFFVPTRLVWDNFQKFNGEQLNPGDSTDYLTPLLKTDGEVKGVSFDCESIFDYFGLPINKEFLTATALQFRAYNLIWNEWFRDENLQNRVTVNKGDGPDLTTDYTILPRGKRHDYFTSCLPWPQKGPGVEIPIGGQAPVFGTGLALGLSDSTSVLASPYGLTSGPSLNTQSASLYTNNFGKSLGSTGNAVVPASTDRAVGLVTKDQLSVNTNFPKSGLYADLDELTSSTITINALREAFATQRMFERDARGGTRYTEIIRSHFGVISPDARLQRPEYLGGTTIRVNVNPVQQTSETSGSSPQGNLAAYGLAADTSGSFSKSFVEHGYIIGLIAGRTDLTYQQGIPRQFLRRTRYDFYWPTLAHLGEQPVYANEIYAQGNAEDNLVFGYQERYAEYRYFPSQITGQFRSTFVTPLDSWHCSEEFLSRPVLGDTFIRTPKLPLDRCLAVPGDDDEPLPQFIADFYFDYKSARPMPVYGVPGLIDHF